ncbi:MAG: hypothetical protein KC482_02230 [Dehalococcoidia bacterium]|nr:hypothetical protein [Dehalococcoidia bacterium]MCA9824956.1 hypothetical protein [Dehalococcoidia bacterium]MCA9844569.1 hypothetical protein [Dehalococcoidia bacterium]MCA9852409.1 hypothetical protein [Dehalococcoidia bacterium]
MIATILLRAVRDPELARAYGGGEFRLDDSSIDALVLALSARRSGFVRELQGMAVGPPEWDVALREAISIGLDDVERVWTQELAEGDVPAHARALAARVTPDTRLVVAGRAASDYGSGLLAFALAEALNLPAMEQVIDVMRENDRMAIHVQARGGRRLTYAVPDRAVLIATRGNTAPYPTVAQRLAARKAAVPVVSPCQTPALRAGLRFEGFGPARPITRHLLRPSTSANAGGRLRQLMSGGATQSGSSQTLAGAGLGDQLADILAKEGFIS